MALTYREKCKIFWKVIKLVKNWHVFLFIYFKFIHDEVVLEMKSGIKIKLRSDSTDLNAFTYVWILEEYNHPGFKINKNDIIIDIGAHIGLFALYASQFCKDGKIYCFEPIKENFNLLLANIELNGISNIIASNKAISTKSGYVTIFYNLDEAGHSMHVSSEKSVKVESVSLSDFLDSYPIQSCNLLKIDCEGEEYGIIDTLESNYFDIIKKMCIEYHFLDEKPSLLENLNKKLISHSYSVECRNISKSIGFLYAKK